MPVVDRDLNERPYKTILVKVVNENDFPLEDMFDGVVYLFEANKEIRLPAEAAHHILGWTETASPRDMFLHVQKRWGWNTPQWADKAQRFFSKLKISTASFKLVEVSDDTPTPDDEHTGERSARRA
jgi:hypothetical protein